MTRLKRLQGHYGLRPDGILGPATLTAFETAAGLEVPSSLSSLLVSRKSISAIVRFEIGSAAHYRRELTAPGWPGGASGVTVGIGYDLGHQKQKQRIEAVWKQYIAPWELEELLDCAGLTGGAAETWLRTTRLLRDVEIPLEAAREVFYRRTLPDYAKKTRRAFPGVEHLSADAQGALLSLVYNRGTSMSGERRREMRQIRESCRRLSAGRILQTLARTEIAAAIREMRRLWIGKNLDGLMRRREKEAVLVEWSDREYAVGEVVAL